MNRLICAVFSMLAFAGAARAETIWVGNFFITAIAESTPGKCGDAAAVGDYGKVTYRPAGAALGNGANSFFAYVGQRSHFTMYVPNNTFQRNINYASQYVTSRVNFGSNVGGILAWNASPAAFDLSTTRATLSATFSNFYGVTGCTVWMRGGLEQIL